MDATMPAIQNDRCGTLYVPRLRWMLRGDMDRVLEIEALSFPFPWGVDDFIRMLRQRNCIGKVAEIRGEVAAYIVYEMRKASYVILNIAVAPHIRRRGLGRLLIGQLQQACSVHRLRSIEAIVVESNLEGQLFFRDRGFRCRKTLAGFFNQGNQTGYRFVWTKKAGKEDD